MTTYRRLKHVPRSCPVCNAIEPGKPLPLEISFASRLKDWFKSILPFQKPWEPITSVEFSGLLKAQYTGWQISRRFFPIGWLGPFWRWETYCADCMFRNALTRPGYLDSIRRTDDWQGGQLAIPLRLNPEEGD